MMLDDFKIRDELLTRGGTKAFIDNIVQDDLYPIKGWSGGKRVSWTSTGLSRVGQKHELDIVKVLNIDRLEIKPEVSPQNISPEWLTSKWGYRSVYEGWDLIYIAANGRVEYVFDSGSDFFTVNEDIVAHICKLHNQTLKVD